MDRLPNGSAGWMQAQDIKLLAERIQKERAQR